MQNCSGRSQRERDAAGTSSGERIPAFAGPAAFRGRLPASPLASSRLASRADGRLPTVSLQSGHDHTGDSPFGPKQLPPFPVRIVNSYPPPALEAAGAAAAASAVLGTRSAPARDRESRAQPQRRDRGAGDAAVCPPGERRGRAALPRPAPRPAPRALLPARERSSARSSAGPMLAVGGSERRG